MYDTCANVNKSFYWCSIDTYYIGRYAICNERCPILAKRLVDDGEIHTSCLHSSSSDTVPYPPTESDIQNILDLHHNKRSDVIPTATDLTFMEWDFRLARIAQIWAQNCIFISDCQGCRNLPNNSTVKIGQSGAKFNGNINYDPSLWTLAISKWASEEEYFIYGVGSTTGKFKPITLIKTILS